MEIGTFLLFAALLFGLLDLISNFWTEMIKEKYSRYFHLVTAGLITVAIMLLGYYLVTNNLWEYSETTVGLSYKISSLWAGPGGSLLLWTFFLYILYVILRLSSDGKNQVSRRAFLLTSIVGVFLIFLTILGQPFGQAEITESIFAVINPVLQNLLLAIHPPIIFVGYAAATIPFAIAIAQYSVKDESRPLEDFEKLYMEICWLFLGLGIVIGGLWAYEALGWGGFWAWDAVETASLIPWLACTAYFHAGAIRSIFGKSKEIAAFATFIFVIFSTFATRGGVISSIHSWSYSTIPSVGWALIIFMIGVTALTFFILFGHGENPSATAYENKKSVEKREPLLNQLLTSKNLNLVLYCVLFVLVALLFIGIIRNQSEGYFNTYAYPFVVVFVLGTVACELMERENVKTVTYGLVAALLFGIIFTFLDITGTGNSYIDFGVGVILVSFLGVIYAIYNDIISRGKLNVKLLKTSRKLIHLSILIILLGVLLSATISIYSIKNTYYAYFYPVEGYSPGIYYNYNGTQYPTLPGNFALTIENISIKNSVGWSSTNASGFNWSEPEYFEAAITIDISQGGKDLGTGVLSCTNSSELLAITSSSSWFSTVLIKRTLSLEDVYIAPAYGSESFNFTDSTNVNCVILTVTLNSYVNIIWIGAAMFSIIEVVPIAFTIRQIRRKRNLT